MRVKNVVKSEQYLLTNECVENMQKITDEEFKIIENASKKKNGGSVLIAKYGKTHYMSTNFRFLSKVWRMREKFDYNDYVSFYQPDLIATIFATDVTKASPYEKHIQNILKTFGFKKPKKHTYLSTKCKDNTYDKTIDDPKSIDAYFKSKHQITYVYHKNGTGPGGGQNSDIDVDFSKLVMAMNLRNNDRLIYIYTSSHYDNNVVNKLRQYINNENFANNIDMLCGDNDEDIEKYFIENNYEYKN